MNNKLSESLISIAKTLEDLAYQHEAEMTLQNDRLNHIEETAEYTKHALKSFAENILNSL